MVVTSSESGLQETSVPTPNPVSVSQLGVQAEPRSVISNPQAVAPLGMNHSAITLTRKDGKKIAQDEICQGNLFMEVLSVYYFKDKSSGENRAAVLLSTQFMLKDKRLKFAKVPLSVLSAEVEFDSYYPNKKEYVSAPKITSGRSKAIQIQDGNEQDNGPLDVISLTPFRSSAGAYDYLQWNYRGTDMLESFPSPVKVLVVVAQKTTGNRSADNLYFHFKLQLDSEVNITYFGIISSIAKSFDTLLHSNKKGGPWVLDITGPYRPADAERALEKARSADDPQLVGLQDAVSLSGKASWVA